MGWRDTPDFKEAMCVVGLLNIIHLAVFSFPALIIKKVLLIYRKHKTHTHTHVGLNLKLSALDDY